MIGRAVPRRGGSDVVSGAERYVADHVPAGALWARVVRSFDAHGDLTGVQTEAAAAHPGVVAVMTARDLGEVGRIPQRVYRTARAERALQPVLAADRVRYVGEPLAVVVATDAATAEDAADLVWATVEPLPLLDDDVIDHALVEHGPPVDEVLAAAAVRVRRELAFGRQTACPMETRGLVATPTARGVRVVGPTKVKHFHRETLAALLGLSPEAVELVEPAVGGSFGARGEFYPEDLLIPWLALKLGAPVAWLEDRHEHFLASNHARDAAGAVEVGLGEGGELLAIKADVVCDIGAYVRTNGLTAGRAIATHLTGPYAWAASRVEVRSVLTHKVPAGTYRAPGAVEATFLRERALDDALRAAGLDALATKRSRLVDTPFATPGDEPMVVESGDLRLMWDAVAPPPETGVLRGVGSAPFLVEEGFGPGDEARVSATKGGVLVEVGIGAAGQGTDTALAQIAADVLGLDVGAVAVEHRELEDPPYSAGTFASRTTVFTGSAVAAACEDFRAKTLSAAADTPVVGYGRFDRLVQTATMGVVFAVVDVVPARLEIRVRRLAGAFDSGRAINPALVDGQIAGAVMQGLGGALLEELPYTAEGQPDHAGFVDYRVPLAAHLPPELDLRRFEFPATSNPLGAKGAGELGIVGVPAAIANAVADAIGAPVDRVPVTPEVLLDALGAGWERAELT